MVSDTEYGDGRRADTYVTRLHPAKYLKCEPLFKELFFPILNMNRNFGFTSCSGIGGITAGLEADGGTTPLFDTPWAKSNGCWRGFAMFTVRSDAIAADAAYKLNCTPQVVGTTTVGGSSQDINSSYRRFNNGPSFINQVDNAQAPDNVRSNVQTFTTGAAIGATFNQFNASMSEVGNLSDIEVSAVQSVNFQHSVGSSSSSTGTTDTEVRLGTPAGVNLSLIHI